MAMGHRAPPRGGFAARPVSTSPRATRGALGAVVTTITAPLFPGCLQASPVAVWSGGDYGGKAPVASRTNESAAE
jgi:hypothetical protein